MFSVDYVLPQGTLEYDHTYRSTTRTEKTTHNRAGTQRLYKYVS
ncbi:MAG: hypothetical protein SVW51_13715 [Pseudomonadota bacterium]|nr:hypothetical protein [Pseudomonadota bacterium]